MGYLLDTHILVWWYTDFSRISSDYLKILDAAEDDNSNVSISVISLWEISKLVAAEKIKIRISLDSWLEDMEQDPLIDVVPLNSKIIYESVNLGEDFPKDPADQLIAATARTLGLKLLTQDKKIIDSGKVLIA